MIKSDRSSLKPEVTGGSAYLRPSVRGASTLQPLRSQLSELRETKKVLIPFIREISPFTLSEALDQAASTETRPSPASPLVTSLPELRSPSTAEVNTPTSDSPSPSSTLEYVLVKNELKPTKKRWRVETQLAPVSEEIRSALTGVKTESLTTTVQAESSGLKMSSPEKLWTLNGAYDPYSLVEDFIFPPRPPGPKLS